MFEERIICKIEWKIICDESINATNRVCTKIDFKKKNGFPIPVFQNNRVLKKKKTGFLIPILQKKPTEKNGFPIPVFQNNRVLKTAVFEFQYSKKPISPDFEFLQYIKNIYTDFKILEFLILVELQKFNKIIYTPSVQNQIDKN